MIRTRLNWRGRQVTAAARAAAAAGLLEAAEALLEEANRTVPFDTGALMRSGESSLDREKLVSAVSYDTPYAVRLHEHPEYRFRRGRRGKWLEQAALEVGGELMSRLRRRVAEALR